MLLEAAEISVSGIFTLAGEVLSGIVNMSGNFFTSLWAHPMGQITIGISLAGAAIGLAYRLFLRKKHI